MIAFWEQLTCVWNLRDTINSNQYIRTRSRTLYNLIIQSPNIIWPMKFKDHMSKRSEVNKRFIVFCERKTDEQTIGHQKSRSKQKGISHFYTTSSKGTEKRTPNFYYLQIFIHFYYGSDSASKTSNV